MAKITITDILSFRDDINSSRDLLMQESTPIREEILYRYKDTVERIGATEDPIVLQKLDAFEKFLKSISQKIDASDMFINRIVASFNGIDDLYWNTVINGAKLEEENRFLKSTVGNLQKREDLIMDGWRGDRRKWNQDRVIMKVS